MPPKLNHIAHLMKPAFTYHTHPNESAFPSSGDIRSTQHPLAAYIDLIVSDQWVTALVQTEKSLKFNENWGDNERISEFLETLEIMKDPVFDISLPLIAATLESVGIGFYHRDSGGGSCRKGSLSGDLVFHRARYIGQGNVQGVW